MSRTAEYERALPGLTKAQVEGLQKEIATLIQERKNQNRFLDIDAEKKELEKLKKESSDIKEETKVTVSKIIYDAKAERDKILSDAEQARASANEYLSTKANEGIGITKEANLKLEKASTVLSDVEEREKKLTSFESLHAREVSDMKSRIEPVIEMLKKLVE